MKLLYRVLVANDSEDLDEKVNKYLADGWRLQGGVSVAMHIDEKESLYERYAQAMVRGTV